MKSQKNAVLLTSLALVIAACVPTGNGTATTGAPGEPVDLSLYEPDPSWECFYLPGLVAVTDVGAALNVLPDDINAEEVKVHQILDTDEGDEAAGAIDERVGFIRSNADPLQVALALTASENPASPIHAMGLAAHWSFAPGTPPRPIEHELPEVKDASTDAAYIAVVDSGIDDTALPGWMAGDNVYFDSPDDVELVPSGNDNASHGTFVASVIRQLNPEYKVTLARAQPIPPNDYVTRPSSHDLIPFDVPSEIHVAYAVERIRQRQQEIVALNLSLGAYICDPAEDALLMTLMTTLEDWARNLEFGIIAAAGNEDLNVPFWPAMMPIVTGVQATDGTSGIVWSSGSPVAGPTGPWVNELAPGLDIIGLRGGGSDEAPLLVAWSGSSFASAVATGLVTRGDAIVPDHAGVGGLSYVDQGQPVTNP